MGEGDRNYHPGADGGKACFFLKCVERRQEQGCVNGVQGFNERQSLLDEEF